METTGGDDSTGLSREALTCATTWTLRLQSKMSQTQKAKWCMVPLLSTSQMRQIRSDPKARGSDRGLGEEGWGMVLEFHHPVRADERFGDGWWW